MGCKIIAIAVLVTLLVMNVSTVAVHTSGPSAPRSSYASRYGPIEPTPPRPVELINMYRANNQSRLWRLRAGGHEPIEPISIDLREPLALQDRDKPGYDISRGDQDTPNRPCHLMTTCMVTTPADSGSGSLRQCLSDAAQGATIDFDPRAFPPTAPATITLLSPLPWIITDTLTIDGSNAGVILDGSRLAEGSGLVIDGANGVTIHGLQILNFPWDGIALIRGASNAVIGGDRSAGTAPLGQGNLIGNNNRAGIWLEGAGTTGNQVLGNYIGTDVTGTSPLGNGEIGVGIGSGANNNVIGGDTPAARNLISGNGKAGVWLQSADTTGNQVVGNYIGTDASGTSALGNGIAGVFIRLDASDNVIGGNTPGARNLISGNDRVGVWLWDADTTGNQVLGNYIGTAATGTKALGNREAGVVVGDGASANVIGGNTPGAGNLISGNGECGVWLQDAGTTGNQVLGNTIGADATGTSALANRDDGVFIGFGASDNVIGGDTPGAGNLISGNGDDGVWMQNSGTTGNQVLGNTIGADATGTRALRNNWDGVAIGYGASDNVIGGSTPGAGNLISGNGEHGVRLQNADTTGNQVLGNTIGADATGTQALGNREEGVFIGFGASDNVIGGDTPGARNLISGNGVGGVQLQDAATTGNQVLGNYIGTDVTGTRALGNSGTGVFIGFGANHSVIGGNTPGARNLISGNGGVGISLHNVGTANNQVAGNYVGTDVTGTRALGNGEYGVVIGGGTSDNMIGGDTPGAGNLISGNGVVGVLIQDVDTTGNRVLGNIIGADTTGTKALGNGEVGVVINFGASDNVIGGHTSGARNLISANGRFGILLAEAGTTGNQVLGNTIGADLTGTRALGNSEIGVLIGVGASANVIGGDTPGAGNLISGNGKVGVWLQEAHTSGNRVLGNTIGADATGTRALGNHEHGVFIGSGASDNVIGGTAGGQGNAIAFSGENGVVVASGTGNAILGNAIFANQGLGIDLGDDGVTPNDDGDGDADPNNLQNFPVIISVTTNGATIITGTLNSTASTRFRLEFFSNSEPDPSGFGEGERFLGFQDATTDVTGKASFVVTFPGTEENITATATDQAGNTSEFSASLSTVSTCTIYLPIVAR